MYTQPLACARMLVLESAMADKPGMQRIVVRDPGNEFLGAKTGFFDLQEMMLAFSFRFEAKLVADLEIVRRGFQDSADSRRSVRINRQLPRQQAAFSATWLRR